MTRLKLAWHWVLAYYRFDMAAVCEMSRGQLPEMDFHDWHDSTLGAPWHMCTHYCRRCGKAFTI